MMTLGMLPETVRWIWWESAMWLLVILWMSSSVPPGNRR
jgi:hypothetical protein